MSEVGTDMAPWSKGLVKKADVIANENIGLLADKISAHMPLIGLEPCAILTLRDEYLELCNEGNMVKARHLAKHTFTIERFLAKEIANGNITSASFHDDKIMFGSIAIAPKSIIVTRIFTHQIKLAQKLRGQNHPIGLMWHGRQFWVRGRAI